MSDNTTGCIGGFVLLGTIAISIGSGVLAWNWVEPKSFGGALAFLFCWSVFSYVGHLLVGGIAALLFKNS